jgi:hypothetical protein
MNWSEYLKPNEDVIESIDGTMQYSGKGTVLFFNLLNFAIPITLSQDFFVFSCPVILFLSAVRYK